MNELLVIVNGKRGLESHEGFHAIWERQCCHNVEITNRVLCSALCQLPNVIKRVKTQWSLIRAFSKLGSNQLMTIESSLVYISTWVALRGLFFCIVLSCEMTSNSDYTIYCYSALEIIWISISPLIVIWDAGYVFLRPYSLPGGSLHTIWKPYSVYGAVDHLYGLPGFNRMDGILPAFATLNLVESILYLWSAYKVLKFSKAMPAVTYQLRLFQYRYIPGRTGFQVVLVIFAASVSVCMKTVLYGKSNNTACHFGFWSNFFCLQPWLSWIQVFVMSVIMNT